VLGGGSSTALSAAFGHRPVARVGLIVVDTYDLDDDLARPAPATPAERGRLSRRWPVLVVLAMVSAIVLYGIDQHDRDRELDALLGQVEQGQSAIRYSDARVHAMVQHTFPQLLSIRAPSRVSANLWAVVQQTAADRLQPMRLRRDAIAELPVAAWHTDLRRARAAYLAYLDERIVVLRAVSSNLRALYQSRPLTQQLLAEARKALLTAASQARSTARIRDLLR
jgi:hypothetical protein